MAFSFRRLSKRFFITANVVVCLVFLFACLQPWLPPENFWFISFISLLLPYLVFLIVLFLLFWIVVKFPYALISLLTLLIGWKQVSALFGTSRESFSIEKKHPEHLRVMSWNVMSLGGIAKYRDSQKHNARQIMDFIAQYNPDVVCMQEYGQYDYPQRDEDHTRRMQEAGYTHFVFSRDYTRAKYSFSNGLAIFSKYPIVYQKKVPFTSSPESMLYCDVARGTDTARIFTAHLQSFKLIDRDFDRLEAQGSSRRSRVRAGLNIFRKMKRAFINRGAQADQIRPYLDSSYHPEIFCGDLNDVPGSYTYWQLRGNERKDAFAEKGFGIGKTIDVLAPTLRIDYLLADPAWQVTQFTEVPTRLSDHYPVIADLELSK